MIPCWKGGGVYSVEAAVPCRSRKSSPFFRGQRRCFFFFFFLFLLLLPRLWLFGSFLASVVSVNFSPLDTVAMLLSAVVGFLVVGLIDRPPPAPGVLLPCPKFSMVRSGISGFRGFLCFFLRRLVRPRSLA